MFICSHKYGKYTFNLPLEHLKFLLKAWMTIMSSDQGMANNKQINAFIQSLYFCSLALT